MLRNPKLSTRWPFRPGPVGRSGLAVSLTAAVALPASLATSAAFAHGDVTPQAVDTPELPSLGEAWRPDNPYRGNDAIEPLPLPRKRDGWAVGCAVKKSSGDLAEAVQQAMATPGSSGEIGRLFAAGRVTWRRP